MASDESGREPSFKVQDRRRFSATGDVREQAAEDSPPPPEPSQVPPPPASSEERSAAEEHRAAGEEAAGEITFASFVFSLSTQALVHLGEVPDPVEGRAQTNLDAARQIIDILAILAEKTRGNLDEAEDRLLESALYDLRMRFVDRARRG